MPARALVIGLESPIARATAHLLAATGVRVAVAGSRGDSVGGSIIEVSGRAGATTGRDGLAVDRLGRDPVAARALVDAACEALGGLDTVIRMDAPELRGPARAVDPVTWATATGRVVGGAFNVTMAAADVMAPGGSIVHVLTLDALHAYPERSAFAAAATGTLGLVRALAIELAARGIRVNAVIAGPIEESVSPDSLPATLEQTRLRSPMGRLGRATEIAEAIRFVAGDDASFMTGQSLRVDGGWAALNQAPAGIRFP